jgi:diguanylate cyclase (GGDEF)-like protein
MQREWADAKRNSQPLSLILLDIDYFKQYNDHYGHIHGDECLKKVAQILDTAAARPRDFLARFGGEEFVLVLPETNAESARKIGERCHDLIAQAEIPHAKSFIGSSLTVSLGIGTVVPNKKSDPTSFIKEVDRRLYEAKQKGRNCIVAGD